MAKLELLVNQQKKEIEVDPNMPLLWALRDYLGLTGTKFSCGIAQCGACTVLVDGEPLRACVIPTSYAVGKQVVTIEGLSENNDHPVQKAFIQEQVPQCGFCQSGQIMSAVALLKKSPNPSEEEIHRAMDGVLCRCGTYPRIKKAIKTASNL